MLLKVIDCCIHSISNYSPVLYQFLSGAVLLLLDVKFKSNPKSDNNV